MLRILAAIIAGLALVVVFWSDPKSEKRILFIGNSFTYGGQVPLQVKNIAAASSPSVRYEVEMVVRGGFTLEQHLTETEALATIQEGNWDVVVLQDASAMPFRLHWTDRMERAATVLAAAARQHNARILYYAHWSPSIEEVTDKSAAIIKIEQTYESLAQRTGGSVARVGRMWQLAEDAGLRGLYASDGHHSSTKGAYAAALAIVVALGDVDPATSDWAPDAVTLSEQDQMRAVVSMLLADSRDGN